MEIKNRQKRKERKRRVAILMLVIVASVTSLDLWQNQQNKAQEAAKKVEEAGSSRLSGDFAGSCRAQYGDHRFCQRVS